MTRLDNVTRGSTTPSKQFFNGIEDSMLNKLRLAVYKILQEGVEAKFCC